LNDQRWLFFGACVCHRLSWHAWLTDCGDTGFDQMGFAGSAEDHASVGKRGTGNKRTYNFWRPSTAILEAANDGNSRTAPTSRLRRAPITGSRPWPTTRWTAASCSASTSGSPTKWRADRPSSRPTRCSRSRSSPWTEPVTELPRSLLPPWQGLSADAAGPHRRPSSGRRSNRTVLRPSDSGPQLRSRLAVLSGIQDSTSSSVRPRGRDARRSRCRHQPVATLVPYGPPIPRYARSCRRVRSLVQAARLRASMCESRTGAPTRFRMPAEECSIRNCRTDLQRSPDV